MIFKENLCLFRGDWGWQRGAVSGYFWSNARG
jgi:hypothetical protein